MGSGEEGAGHVAQMKVIYRVIGADARDAREYVRGEVWRPVDRLD